jgi:His Kinase A (phosphoacceptor) domain.
LGNILIYITFIAILTSIVYTWQKRQQRRREEQNNEDKLKFFINIAHEIRSPTTLIISPLSELLKTEYDEKTKKLLETIQRNAHRIMSPHKPAFGY